jgi:Transposase
MKKSKFTDEQIAFALRQAEGGVKVAEICRKMGISDAIFCKVRNAIYRLMPVKMVANDTLKTLKVDK